MDSGTVLLVLVTLQRFAEFIWDRQNTARLLKAGAVEFGRTHYPMLIATHAGWLAGLWLFGYNRAVDPVYVFAFILLEVGRSWVLASLGRRWTTRIIVLPGVPLIRTGPYRFLRHPNYVVVAGELVVVPLALGLPLYALLFFLIYACVIAVRIRAENAALTSASSHGDVDVLTALRRHAAPRRWGIGEGRY